jgi:hypothetical protein
LAKRALAQRLFSIHLQFLLVQALLFIIMECTRGSMPVYWTVAFMLEFVFGMILLPMLASRRMRRKSDPEFERLAVPGSGLLQVGACCLIFAMHFDTRLILDVFAVALMLFGLFLLQRGIANKSAT